MHLENKSKMSRPIRGQDSHLGFQITLKEKYLFKTSRYRGTIVDLACSGSEEVDTMKSL